MSNKTRLDVLLVERGLEQTRQRAQAMIMSGLVFVDGQRVDKAGTAIPNDAQIEVRGNTLRYVSRGGLKLEKAMTTFGLRLDGCVCADIGSGEPRGHLRSHQRRLLTHAPQLGYLRVCQRAPHLRDVHFELPVCRIGHAPPLAQQCLERWCAPLGKLPGIAEKCRGIELNRELCGLHGGPGYVHQSVTKSVVHCSA